MKNLKKLNLLPDAIKNKYANKFLAYTAGVLCVLLFLFLSVQYVQIGVLSWQTNKIIESNQKYDKEKETILNLQASIEKYKGFMANYENDCFPFSMFMYDLEAFRPSDVFIISVDSSERLINEGVIEEKSDKPKKQEQEKTSEKKSDKEAEDKTAEGTETKIPEPKIEYTEDLSGREIVIRGFGGNQESISKYIYDITHLAYIGGARITAVEEHKIENGVYNIFEIKVMGGVYR